MTRRTCASERQMQASIPRNSVWLSANAGSGKTKVLIDRVARMLLNGTQPHRILCLTYTRAAAAQMQNRLFDLLGDWAMMDEPELRKRLKTLGETDTISPGGLANARRLFARAIETPGGLKIQTIHAFCASLLRRFPLEAGVPHGFEEMDGRAGDLMREDILEQMAAGEDRPLLDALLTVHSGEGLRAILAQIGRDRDGFLPPRNRATLFAAYGLAPDHDMARLLADVFQPGDLRLLQELAPICRTGGSEDNKLADLLEGVTVLDHDALVRLEQKLCFGKSAKKPYAPKLGKVVTKTLGNGAAAGHLDALDDLARRVAQARETRLALAAAEQGWHLHRFAHAYLGHVDHYKAARGWLDFDDLIVRTERLLSDASVAQWVLFRLDGGLDHILVDEAQDTSLRQWKVIERIAAEFTAGEGARGAGRTLFVVGDRKQSIYSFQGADLKHFEAMQTHFRERFAAIGHPIQALGMEHSFRSSPAIVRLVDLTFGGSANVGLGGAPNHIAFHDEMPGRVDLWPVVPDQDEKAQTDWEDPVDQPGTEAGTVVLARTIAAEIRAMIETGVRIPDKGGPRRVHEGDFLVLVRRRSALFGEIIRACKSAGLKIAGADRLRLGAEMAVRDIRALLGFLATPEDDLSLAEALRSPLLGWGERALFQLAHPRKGYLWAALRHDTAHPATLQILNDLRDTADFLRPFELIERLLIRHGGRERLIARLGPEAEDGIDELVSQALAYERSDVPSLTGFLGWLDADDVEVKRQFEGAGDAIRVMTVHGAKGLESPIVILPETARKKSPNPPKLIRLSETLTGWRQTGEDAPAIQRMATGSEGEARDQEAMRLLYVAMTRAEKWLIIAATGEVGAGNDTWYSMMKAGLETAGTRPVCGHSAALRGLGDVARFSHGDWPGARAPDTRVAPSAPQPDLPDWVQRPAPRPEGGLALLSPSALGGAKALPGDRPQLDEEVARQRGRQIHRLLEHLPHLPEADWRAAAESLLLHGEDALLQEEVEPVLDEVRRVMRALEAADWLDPDSLAEVEITAELAELGGQRIHGCIDRLMVTPDQVRLLDYKSNAVVPQRPEEVPDGIVRQIAAYRAALRQIHPGKPIHCAILWTASAQIMPLAHEQLDAALRTPPYLHAPRILM